MTHELGIIMREFKNIKIGPTKLTDEEKEAKKRLEQTYHNFFEALQSENNEYFAQVSYPIHRTFSVSPESSTPLETV